MKKSILCLLLAAALTPALYACEKQEQGEIIPPEISAPLPSDPTVEPDTPTPPPAVDKEENKPTEPEVVVKTDELIICKGTSVNLRSSPSTSASVVGTAEKNTRYLLREKKGNWYAVYYKNKIAYLHADYAQTFSLEKSDDERIEQVIEIGYKLVGTKYVYGATRLHNGKGKLLGGFSVAAFDCSSLMQYIFYHGASVNLDVNTRTQVVQGKYVSKSNLRRGDCIYFTNEYRVNNTGINRVGHVGIYLGNDYMLHTASDYARIVKMSDTRYWNYYIETRRFI
ncbi:MAG: C40 family peptidase [Clostridia bacterium]|nr:C40 family peptidase [Clostridia bacterium]